MTGPLPSAPGMLGTLAWPAQPVPPDGGTGDEGGGLFGDAIGSIAASAFDAAMQKVWDAGVWVLRGGFTLADDISGVDANSVMGGEGAGALWPSLLWLSAMIALGLFFYQLTAVALRGGRGMFRAFTGPAQFGIAIAVTTGTVATLLTASDELTTMVLNQGLDAASFATVLDNPDVAARVGENPELGDVEEGVRSMLLGLAAVFGIIPAGIGFALQMIFRQAAILVLVATIPICAAGLVADTTAAWFWKATRWMLAAIVMKPALALVLVIGVNIMARAEGVAGLLAGTAVLLVALFCPMALYRLLAFVDPGTGAGMAIRSGGGSRGASEPGSDNGSSEAMNIARQSEQATGMGGGSGSSSATDAAGGGGELGGTTASPAAAGRTAGAGAGAGGGAAGGSAGAGTGGGAAAGALGAAGGAAAAAVVGGYLATKAAGQAAGGFASEQMAQTGVGNPGPAPSGGPTGAQISSSAGAASAAVGNWSTGGGDGAGGGGGEPPDPPAPAPGPAETGPPDGPNTPAPPEPEPPGPAAPQEPDTPGSPPEPGTPSPPDSGPPTRPDLHREDPR